MLVEITNHRLVKSLLFPAGALNSDTVGQAQALALLQNDFKIKPHASVDEGAFKP
jgi:hypothetical protein